MIRKTKGHAGCHQATSNTSICAYYFNFIAPRMKGVIVTLALWGLIPARLASWLIDRLGLRHE